MDSDAVKLKCHSEDSNEGVIKSKIERDIYYNDNKRKHILYHITH